MEKVHFSDDQKKVLTVIEKMATSFHNKDIEGVLSVYEPGATVVFEPGKPISDTHSLKEAFQEAFAFNPKYMFHGHEVFINGSIATHFTPWTMTATLPDGTTMEQSGLSVAVLRQQQDGSWLMLFDNPHGQFLMEQ